MTLRTDQQATGMTKETERPMSDEQTKQERVPIDMLLYCPQCGLQHIDEPDERTPEWDNPPHRSHLCHACGCVWRPADVTTNGVRAIGTVGKADTWTKQERVSCPAAIDDDEVEREVHPALQAAIDHTRANIAAAFSARSKVNTAMRPHPDERVEVLVKAARDALSGWTYIRMFHGDLPGVGWDRVEQSLRTALASVSTKTGGV